MKFIALLLAIILVMVTIFAALNWHVLVATTTITMGVADFEAPLGLLMFGVLALLTVLFLVFVVYLQTSLILENRRHAHELQANRDLATKAETSRYTELHKFLESELKRQAEAAENTRADMLARLEQAENDLLNRVEQSENELRGSVEQLGNTLIAYIGELEDRLEKWEKDEGAPKKPGSALPAPEE